MANEPKKTVLGWTADPHHPHDQHGYNSTPSNPYGTHDTVVDTQLPEYLQGYASSAAYEQTQLAPQHQPYAQQPQPVPHTQQPAHAPMPYGYPYTQPAQHQQAYPAYPQYPQNPQQPQPHAYGTQPPPYGQHQSAPGSYAQVAPNYGYVQHAAAAAHALKAAEQPAAGRQKQKKSKPQRPVAGADATVGASQRTRFIRLTYLHLLLAILAFAGLSYLFQTVPFLVENVSAPFFRFAIKGRWNWAIVLAAFMAVSWVADYWASHATSRGMQYLGLGVYILAEALIFVPLLVLVQIKTASIIAKGGGDPNILRDSAYVTLGIFGALTASVFLTKKDFSFLRSGLMMASGAALMLIVLSLAFGFNLGLVFSIAMVLLAAGYILYQTSQVLAHYDPNQHVAAALALFSSVALMFWYVIRIFMRARE